MYHTYVLLAGLVVLAFLLIHYKPQKVAEHFTVAAVDPVLSPACTARSADAQRLLARFAGVPESDTDAAELRQLVSKLCCMDADISSPVAGTIRTQPFQFRTSHDMDTASSFVGRCLRNAVQQRDIDLVIDKFADRGHDLVKRLCPDSAADAAKDFDAVLGRTRWAMVSFCLKPQPSMDKPAGPRDIGFWESQDVADLDQYQGFSASPK